MAVKNEDGFTPLQNAFVEEYPKDMNGQNALIRAGYSPNHAKKAASANLKNPLIATAIEKKCTEIGERVGITKEKVLKELAKIAFSNISDYVVWDNGKIVLRPSTELSKSKKAAVVEISETTTREGTSVKFKMADKMRALEAIARHLGMFIENRKKGEETELPEIFKSLSDKDLNAIDEILSNARDSESGERAEKPVSVH